MNSSPDFDNIHIKKNKQNIPLSPIKIHSPMQNLKEQITLNKTKLKSGFFLVSPKK